MKLLLESDIHDIEKGSAYMLRNDGRLLSVEDVGLHPYIVYIIERSVDDSMSILFNEHLSHFEWFYKNTRHNSTRNNLRQLGIEYYCSGYFKNFSYRRKIELQKIIGVFDESDSIHISKEEITDLLYQCNNECNQEFCRVRTSSLKFGISDNGIYFRISSVGFNWFNLIWEVVYNFKNRVSDVTICTDTQSRGGRLTYYQHNGKEINRMPVDEFITLSGNPIIESYKNNFYEDLAKGLSLEETFSTHPRRINEIVNLLWKEQLNNKFMK